jgi:hypothetical protein
MKRLALLFALLCAREAGAVLPTSCPVGICNPRDFGAICDGSVHALSTRYGSLGAAQADYPFVTSTAQQIDWAAHQQTSNVAFGPLGSEKSRTDPTLNVPIYLPPGRCMFGNDTWEMRYLKGGRITGASPLATVLTSNAKVLRFYGLWYSEIANLGIVRGAVSGSEPALDIDGLTGAGTLGVQFNTFPNLSVDGGGNSYAVSVCLTGGGSGQCSSLTFINPAFSNATEAVYYQNGLNALGNQIIGGDMQTYTKNGVRLTGGAIQILGTTFESISGYTQLLNSGCDVQASDAGAEDAIVVHGSRSESFCFYNGAFSQFADLRGITHTPDPRRAWSASTTFAVNAAIFPTNSDTNNFGTSPRVLWRVTTGGISGATEPAWPSGGTQVDGGVTWQATPYNAVNIVEGTFDSETSHLDASASLAITSSSLNATSCGGGSPTIAANSTRARGSVTEGTSATGCLININFWHSAAPVFCTVSSPDSAAFSYGIGQYTLTIGPHASQSGKHFNWVCSQ